MIGVYKMIYDAALSVRFVDADVRPTLWHAARGLAICLAMRLSARLVSTGF